MTKQNLDHTRDAADAPAQEQQQLTIATTRDQFIEAYGPMIGPALYDIEVAGRRTLAEKGQKLVERLEALKVSLDEKTAEGEAALVPLKEAMDLATQRWLAACEAYERCRVGNQATLVPINDEIAEVLKEINTPMHSGRIRQWGTPGAAPAMPSK